MSIQELGNLGEFIASIAVLISLIYLAFQIRQNTRQLKQSAFNLNFQSFSSLRRSIYSDPVLTDLLIKAKHSALDKSEALRYENFVSDYCFAMVQLWTFWRAGHVEITSDAMESAIRNLAGMINHPTGLKHWHNVKPLLNADFIEKMENTLRESRQGA